MYDSKSGMTIPKKGPAPKTKSVSNYGDHSKNMGGVSQKPTTLPNKSTLKGTTNGKGRRGYNEA